MFSATIGSSDNTSGRRTAISVDPSESVRSAASKNRSLEQACLCAKIADEYRGQETVVLDLTRVTPIVDFFVVTSAASKRQMHAIADEVDRVLSELGSARLGSEGYEGSSWLLQDYGDVVLHVFTPETRRMYDLEHLWADASRVDWRTIVDGPGP